LIILLSGFT